VIPDLAPDIIIAAQRADAHVAESRARAEELATIVDGSAKPLAALLEQIERYPRQTRDAAWTLFDPATAPAPLAGGMVSKYAPLGALFGTKPDAARLAAEATLPDLARALDAFGGTLSSVEYRLTSAHRDVQRYAKVEIPAPSPMLAALLRDETRDVTKLAPEITAELSKLRLRLAEGLLPTAHRQIHAGDLTGLAATNGLTTVGAKRLFDTHAQVKHLGKALDHQRRLTQSRSITR
jgi:hypothetical protein